VNRINPRRKLTFEFSSLPEQSVLDDLRKQFEFNLDFHYLTAELKDDEMNRFLSRLFVVDTPRSFSLEELPVEETMKSFFANPEKFV